MTRRVGTRSATLKATLGAALVFALSSLATPAMARADLVVLQDSNGFPGGADTETARQKVFIGGQNLRVLDEQHAWALYVRLGQKVVREASSVDKTFVEKPLDSYAKIREKREATRAELVAEYHKAVKKAPDDSVRANLKRDLEAMGLREDGKTFARLEPFPADSKTISIVVNDVRKDLKVDHYIVRENEGPAVFDVWVAPELARPDSIFTFYKELGTFSTAVVDKVLELPGFPVEIEATLDDGNNKKKLRTKVFEVREEAIAPTDYDVPAGWAKVEGRADPGEKAATMKCEICGKEFVVSSGDGGQIFKDPYTRAPHPVCSAECRRIVLRKLGTKPVEGEKK